MYNIQYNCMWMFTIVSLETFLTIWAEDLHDTTLYCYLMLYYECARYGHVAVPGAPEKGPKCPDQSVLALVKYIFEFSFRFLSWEINWSFYFGLSLIFSPVFRWDWPWAGGNTWLVWFQHIEIFSRQMRINMQSFCIQTECF